MEGYYNIDLDKSKTLNEVPKTVKVLHVDGFLKDTDVSHLKDIICNYEIKTCDLSEMATASDIRNIFSNVIEVSYFGQKKKKISGTIRNEIGDGIYFNLKTIEDSCCTKATCIVLPKRNFIRIPECFFFNCTSLTSIQIPKNVKTIGKYTFSNCLALRKLILPDDLTRITEGLFINCNQLKEITIPDSVCAIESEAFAYCSSLTKINISKDSCLEEVWYRAFEYCTSLEEIEFPAKVFFIGEAAFYKCSSLKYIELPKLITEIGVKTFSGCSSLKEVKWRKNTKIETVGVEAFSACKSLVSISFPKNTIDFGQSCFADCESLQDITITTKFLKANAFANCVNLKNVTISPDLTESTESTNEFMFSDDCFKNCKSLNVFNVPYTKKVTFFIGDRKISDEARIEFSVNISSYTNTIVVTNYCREITTDTKNIFIKMYVPDSVKTIKCRNNCKIEKEKTDIYEIDEKSAMFSALSGGKSVDTKEKKVQKKKMLKFYVTSDSKFSSDELYDICEHPKLKLCRDCHYPYVNVCACKTEKTVIDYSVESKKEDVTEISKKKEEKEIKKDIEVKEKERNCSDCIIPSIPISPIKYTLVDTGLVSSPVNMCEMKKEELVSCDCCSREMSSIILPVNFGFLCICGKTVNFEEMITHCHTQQDIYSYMEKTPRIPRVVENINYLECPFKSQGCNYRTFSRACLPVPLHNYIKAKLMAIHIYYGCKCYLKTVPVHGKKSYVEENINYCPYQNAGCNYIGETRKDIVDHLNDCDFAMKQCCFCLKYFEKKYIEHHTKINHENSGLYTFRN